MTPPILLLLIPAGDDWCSWVWAHSGRSPNTVADLPSRVVQRLRSASWNRGGGHEFRQSLAELASRTPGRQDGSVGSSSPPRAPRHGDGPGLGGRTLCGRWGTGPLPISVPSTHQSFLRRRAAT